MTPHINPNHVCHVKKSLYGLKLGFTRSKADTSLFIFNNDPHPINFLIYVDDIIVTGSNSHSISQLIGSSQADFALNDRGPLNYFIGVEAQDQDNKTLAEDKILQFVF